MFSMRVRIVASGLVLVVLAALGISAAAASSGPKSITGTISGLNNEPLLADTDLYFSLYDENDISVNFQNGPLALDAESAFTIDGLPAGTYKLEVRDESWTYQHTYSGDTPVLADAEVISLDGDDPSATVHIEMERWGSIQGRVTGPGGAPHLPTETCGADGMSLLVNDKNGRFLRPGIDFWPLATDGHTDENGNYQIGRFPPGEYIIEVERSCGYARTYSGGSVTLKDAIPVSVTFGAPTQAPDFELAVGGSISGTVTEFGGTPLDRTDSGGVVLYDSSGQPFDSNTPAYFPEATAIGPDGKYRFDGLPSGDYRVEVADNRVEPLRPPTFSGGASTLSKATPISVTLGVESTGNDIEKLAAGSISGRIVAPKGAAANLRIRGEVNVYTADGDQLHRSSFRLAVTRHSHPVSESVQEDGSFRIDGLPSGEYRLEYSDFRSNYVSAFLGGTSPGGPPTSVLVERDTETAVGDLEVEFANVIVGTVTGEGGVPLKAGSDVTVTAFDQSDARVGETKVAADGTYRIAGLDLFHFTTPIPPRPFRLEFADKSGTYNPEFHSNKASLADATPVWVHPNADASVANEELALAPSSPTAPSPVAPGRNQKLPFVPKSLQRKKSKKLGKMTRAGIRTKWITATPRICKIKGNKVVARKRVGTCRITAIADGDSTWLPVRQTFRIKVK